MVSTDYTLIHPGLAQGSAPTDSLASFEEFDTLVLCAAEWQPVVSFPENDKSKKVIRCPFDDNDVGLDKSTLKMIRRTVTEIVEEKKQGRRILITCFAGINRSGLIMGLVLRELLDMSGYEVISLIRRKRYGALSNQVFRNYLIYAPRLS